VAETLQPFLKKFQGDNPLLPFLAEELYSLLKLVLERFIKPEVLNKANTKAKLANIDMMAAENVVHRKCVELGFATLQHLRKAEREKTVSDLQVLTFRKECPLFL
jgi:Zn ribbon nucleic-acid-binding protein